MAETILYLDPWSGVSGDMLLAALLDTDRGDGRLEAELGSAMAGLGIEGIGIEMTRDFEWGIACTRVRVTEGARGPTRHLAEIERIIAGAAVSATVKKRAAAAFRRLAAVEAEIHGCALEEIHFHELGAVDTLVDIVGVLTLVEAVGATQVAISSIPVGGGTVEIAHGCVGVPAPATARLLAGYQIVGGPEPRELTTPTGALLVGQLAAKQGALPQMTLGKVGYGAGSMKLESGPNLLRVMLGTLPVRESEAAGSRDQVVELETNLDDISPETIGYTAGALRQAGALDVWTAPAFMKKDRPGTVLHVLARPEDEEAVASLVFEQTGTLGIRRALLSRYVAERGSVTVMVEGLKVRVKWGRWAGRVTSVAPEYEDAATAAASSGLPLTEVMRLAAGAARQTLGYGEGL